MTDSFGSTPKGNDPIEVQSRQVIDANVARLDPLIFVISGPSGTGKGTIVERLLAQDSTLWLSRSWTTRARRMSESPLAYNFVDRETFLAHAQKDGFVEYAEVFDNFYGTPVPTAPAGSDVVFEIDVQGAQQIHERFSESLLIFIEPPSRQIQRERLLHRGENEETVARRLAKADAEETIGHKIANFIVVNDDLEMCVATVTGIVEAARKSRLN